MYDDFSSGTIDTQKWAVDDSSADISIENGEAKFVHSSGFPNDSSWLTIIDNPEDIIGIMTRVRVQSCTGDVQGRAGGFVGKIDENVIWSSIRARDNENRISTDVALLDPANNYNFLYDLFFGSFYYNWDNPIMDITGKTFILEWMFTPEGVSFKADDVTGTTESYGEMVFNYPDPVQSSENAFRAIGTRSSAGDGPCTVYFDDVYVYRQD